LKILILKPSSLGDVIHAIPVLRNLKQGYPEAEIYWWISAQLSSLLERDPDLTGVFLFHRKKSESPFHWPTLLRELRRMRRMGFTHVIDLQSLARSGITAWLANGEVTIGLDDAREGASTFYDVRVPRPTPKTHAVDWYLQVLPYFNLKPHFRFDWLPYRSEVARKIRQTGVAEKRIILNPGARWDNKRWPAEYFRELLQILAAKYPGYQLVLLGGKSDYELSCAIKKGSGTTLDLTGQTSLLEMVEVIRGARAMITNDTGPMHIAAAVGTPLVPIFGPTEPARTGPYGQIASALQASLPCIPCMKPACHYPKPLECLRLIQPERVARVVESMLENERRAAARA
jgi:lipopolysaccharide heptosyltransferase II